ncbi:putative F-box/kelch-repeat protein [Raphanus sativus]|nr:putative F-box/kelch-repeat protein [Raphanus sativus]
MESSSPSSLIPGLPDDVAELCLSRIPRCDFRTASRVCRKWRTFLRSERFSAVRKLTGPVEEFTCVLMEGRFVRDRRFVNYLYGEVFDASGNNVGQIPRVPGPFRSRFGVAVLGGGGGKIVIIGGYVEVEGSPIDGNTIYASADVYEFDPATNSWRNLAPMKVPRHSFAFAVVDGLLYVIRGRSSDGKNLLSSEVYNPETNQWSLVDCPDRPDFRRAFAFSFKSKLFVVGAKPRFIDIYDPKTDTWEELRSGRSKLLSVYSYTVIRNKVYFFDHYQPGLGVIDPEKNSWSSVSVPMAPGAYWFRLGEWNNKVMLIARVGGCNALTGDLDDKANASKWTVVTQIKPSGSNATIVLLNF